MAKKTVKKVGKSTYKRKFHGRTVYGQSRYSSRWFTAPVDMDRSSWGGRSSEYYARRKKRGKGMIWAGPVAGGPSPSWLTKFFRGKK